MKRVHHFLKALFVQKKKFLFLFGKFSCIKIIIIYVNGINIELVGKFTLRVNLMQVSENNVVQ